MAHHNNIGIDHLYAEKYDEALSSFQEAVNVRTVALGPEQPDVLVSACMDFW